MNHNLIDTGAYQDNYNVHVLKCEQDCGYELHVPWRDKRLHWDEKKRISHELEIQEAIEAGLTGSALFDMCQRYARQHHWSSVPWLRITGLTTGG